MAVRRRIRWPAYTVALALVLGLAWVLANPGVLAPLGNRLVNRHLEATTGGSLRVGRYVVRPLAGLDAIDVTLTLPGERGGLTMVAVDTLSVDFRLSEVAGRRPRLRRVAATGVEVYRMADAPDPDAAGGDGGGSLPRLTVDVLDIRDARAELSGDDGRLQERVADLWWRGELDSGDDGLVLVTRSGRLSWPTRGSSFDQVYGAVRLDGEGIHFEDLGGIWNGGRASVSGLVGDGVVDLRASGRGADAAAVTELTGVLLDFDASGDIDCTVVSRNDTVRFEGDFTGRFLDWDLDGVHAEAIIAHDIADFAVLRGGVGGARFDGNLHVDARDPADVTVTITGEGRDLDLTTGLIPGDPADLPRTGGDGRVRIVHRTMDESTTVTADLGPGFIEIMPFDQAHVEVWARQDTLHFRDVDLRHGTVHARLAGSSDRDEYFRGYVDLDVADLRDLPPGWGWPEITGGMDGRAALSGPIDQLEAAGAVALRDAALAGVAVDTATVRLLGRRVLVEDWTLDASADADGFALAGVPLGRSLAWLQVDAAHVAVDSFRTVLADTVVTVRGRADLSPGRADLDVERFTVSLAGTEWRTDRRLTMAVGAGLVDLPRLRLESDRGDLLATVRYVGADSVLAGDLKLSDFDLNLLDPLLRRNLRLGGRATAAVTMGGRPDAPEFTVDGRLVGAVFDLARVDSLAVRAQYGAGVVHVDTLDLLTDYGRVGMRGSIGHPGVTVREFWPGAALDCDVTIAGGDWAFLHQFEDEVLAALDGRVDGRLHVAGTTDRPLVTGDMDSGPFDFQWLHLDRLSGTVRAESGQLALGALRGHQDQLRLEGRLEIPLLFDFLSEPVTPPDGFFFGRLTVPPGTDLAPLAEATDGFTTASGRGQAEFIVSGPLDHPRYQGEVLLEDAGFVIRGNEEVFHHCSARGIFRDDLLIVQNITGREGLKGTFTGAGTVTFEGLLLKTWDITFKADRFLVASIPELRAIVRTDNGRLTGVAVGPDSTLVPRFTGDFEVIKGRYTGNFAAQTGGPDPTLGTLFPDWLADVHITGPPRTARIVNRTMDLDLSGDVDLVRTADGMTIIGGMNIDKGRLPVFNNTFNVVRGSLDFSREVGVIPTVDIDAETKVRLRSPGGGSSIVERITVHAAGPASAMEITYSSESGYPREAIERMLLGLSPYPDEQGDAGALTNASISAGLNILEREIAQEIDLFDTVEIDQIQRQQAGATTLDPLIGVGKYVGTDLYIKYAQGVNQNDRDLLLEYQITDHLLLQTEIRRRIDEYQGDATYNLDLKYRVEY
jgi:hypothetical protein